MVATTMNSLFVALFALVASSFRTRAALQTEILALRHQLAVLQKNAPRRFAHPPLRPAVVGCAVLQRSQAKNFKWYRNGKETIDLE